MNSDKCGVIVKQGWALFSWVGESVKLDQLRLVGHHYKGDGRYRIFIKFVDGDSTELGSVDDHYYDLEEIRLLVKNFVYAVAQAEEQKVRLGKDSDSVKLESLVT
jgi:hypothetical protein